MSRSPVSYAEKTMNRLRRDGYMVAKVEKWITTPGREICPTCNQNLRPAFGPPGRRVDVYGIGDGLAVRGDDTLLLQWCAQSGIGKHYLKVLEATYKDPTCELCKKGLHEGHQSILGWLNGGTRRFEIWGWRKLSPRGTKREKWEPDIREIEIVDDEGDRTSPVRFRMESKETAPTADVGADDMLFQ